MKTGRNTVLTMFAFLAAFAAVFASCDLFGTDEEPTAYTVKYHANGGTGKMASSTFTYAKEYTLPKNTFTRQEYIFAGWMTNNPTAPYDYSSSYYEKYYTDGERIKILDHYDRTLANGTLNLYARWYKAFTIRYDANGGIGEMADTPFIEGAPLDLPKNTFTRENYAFTGWAVSADGAKKYNDGQSVNYIDNVEAGEAVTLYAVWEAGAYTLYYDRNGGTGTVMGMGSQTFKFDVEQNLQKNTFSRTNYIFIGWAASPDGPAEYTDGQSVVNLTDTAGKTVTLYAVWGSAYAVTYNANGGSEAMYSQNFARGVPQNLRANTFTRTGYTFVGWAVSANGPAVYADEQSFTLNEESGVILYAVWSFRPDAYYVQYHANNGSGATAVSALVINERQPLRYNTFVKTGYTFAGWAETASGAVQYSNWDYVTNLTETPKTIVNLYAVWSAIKYTVKYNNNGGSGTMADSTFTYDAPQNLRKNAFTCSGYAFRGWAESSSATAPVKYTDEQSVSNLTATAGGTVNLYAAWIRTYTVKYNANNGSGNMDDTAFISGEAQNLRANAFTRTGYTFMGWAESSSATAPVKYTDGQSVNNLTATAGGAVYLYAVWRNNYTVKYDANSGSGTMADTAFISGEAQNLRANAFTKTGYTFIGWAESASGAVKYTDGQSVNNLTAEGNGIFTLYAVWRTNYTVIYNNNGGSGTMASSLFTYGAAQNLRANAFTKTGYTFTGWAESASGTVQYTDGQSVLNLADAAGDAVTLYAVWKANNYTVKYDANGGSGTMADTPFVYDVPQNLRTNAFTRTGYIFRGWAASINGTVEYTDGKSVNNLTATPGGTVTLFAKWDNTYTVKYNANGGSDGTMDDTAFTLGVPQNLRANAFTRTGYTFAGWAETASGAVKYADGESVSNLTATPGGTVNLYAKWSGIKYTVRYDANVSGSNGTMADQTFTYDVGQTLRASTFTRLNYRVTGWAASPDGPMVYTGSQYIVENLTAEAGEMITLYAVWINTYTVVFNASGGTGGSMQNTVFTFDVPQDLPANKFIRANYTFAGWSVNSSGSTVDYYNEQNVSNLSAGSATVNLYARWKSNYTVKYNANGGSGTMSDQSFVYDTAQNLRPNAFTPPAGYTFAGWATTASGAVAHTDEKSVSNLIASAGATVNLFAKWSAVNYTVRYDANEGGGTMADSAFTYDAAQALRANTFTRANYRFTGWAASPDGPLVYANQQSVSNLTAAAGETVTLYAVWINTYTVIYDANGGAGTMEDSVFTYGVPQNISANAFTRTGYIFTGWTPYDNSNIVRYTDEQSASNLAATTAASVTLHALWEGIKYTVSYDANGGAGSMGNQTLTYGSTQTLSANAFTRTNYRFAGWSTSASGPVQYDNGQQSAFNLTAAAGETVTLYAIWSNTYTVIFNASGASGTMANQTFTIGEAQKLRKNTFTTSVVGSSFKGWSTTQSSSSWNYTDEQNVTNVTATAASITLYAVWGNNTYSISFNPGGGAGNIPIQNFTYGETKALLANQFTPPTGYYSFAGWATSSSSKTVVYADKESVGNLTATPGATIYLYAVWTPNTYIVRFDANGGTGTMADQTFTYDVAQNLSANTFRKQGSTFQGWAVSSNYSKKYADKESVKNVIPNGSITLYAVWVP